VRRTIWDGDQVLAEIQAPGETGVLPVRMELDHGVNAHVATGSLVVATGLLDAAEFAPTDTVPQAQTYLGFHFGRVLYTHGPGIDAPLSLVRMDYSDSISTPQLVVLHNDWRGQYDLGSYNNGTLSKPCRRITRSSQFQTYTSDGQIDTDPKFSADEHQLVPLPGGGVAGAARVGHPRDAQPQHQRPQRLDGHADRRHARQQRPHVHAQPLLRPVHRPLHAGRSDRARGRAEFVWGLPAGIQ
jgi:hypothetical protein